MTGACPEGPGPLPAVGKHPRACTGTLTTCSLIWMHRDFFLMAAIPVVKVFRMLVARRSANCEPPSRPAMEPESTVALPARPRNRLLMIFLPEEEKEGKKSYSGSSRGRSSSQLLGHRGRGSGLSGPGLHVSHPTETLQRNPQTAGREKRGGWTEWCSYFWESCRSRGAFWVAGFCLV